MAVGIGPRSGLGCPTHGRRGASRLARGARGSGRARPSHIGSAVVADVPEPPPELNTKHTVVLELTTRVTRALPALGAVRPRGDMTAFDFVNSDAATRAALAGGPEAPIPVPHASEARFFQDKDLSEVSLWRVKAPGFAGRLFFVGPQVTLFPVNVFALETTREASLDAAVLTLTQIRGEMEGTPGAVVRWINGAYRAERTVTSVRVDPARATITTSLDLRVVVEVPAPFRWVDKKKIEVGMREAFEQQTEDAMGKVCNEIAAAFVEWASEA